MWISMEKYQYLRGDVSACGVALQLAPHGQVHVYHVINALDAIHQKAAWFYKECPAAPLACTMVGNTIRIQTAREVHNAPVLFTVTNERDLYESLRPYLMLLVKG